MSQLETITRNPPEEGDANNEPLNFPSMHGKRFNKDVNILAGKMICKKTVGKIIVVVAYGWEC